MNRFFISESEFKAGRVTLGKEHAHQIRSVLRMSAGERITVLDNHGREFEVLLEDVARNRVAGRVIEERPASGEPAVHLTLYQSLLARDKFEWVLQKCTEVGVARFVPVVTNRSVVRDPGLANPTKLERWRRIVTEAAEQSGRGRIPELVPAMRFGEVLPDVNTYDRCLICCPLEQGSTLRDALSRSQMNPAAIALFIGPEGGFTGDEIRLARAAAAVPVNLGPRILRTETAAVVATALILHELGQIEST